MLSEELKKYLESDDKYGNGSTEACLLWDVQRYVEKMEIEKREPLSKMVKKFLGWYASNMRKDDYDLMIRVCDAPMEYEKQDKKDHNSWTKGAIDDTGESQTASEKRNLTKKTLMNLNQKQ